MQHRIISNNFVRYEKNASKQLEISNKLLNIFNVYF